ncbi:hypothetical protein CKY11_10815 [Enterococcus hirae]|nr:hypothetical protein CKY11_10815 [Enterococcus hirae]PCE04244.1 hypothetical protein CKY13_12620 [Enterococcus hirae]ROZ16305.1 hypothetical protein EGX06_01935 [Enterococcus hirae]
MQHFGFSPIVKAKLIKRLLDKGLQSFFSFEKIVFGLSYANVCSIIKKSVLRLRIMEGIK